MEASNVEASDIYVTAVLADLETVALIEAVLVVSVVGVYVQLLIAHLPVMNLRELLSRGRIEQVHELPPQEAHRRVPCEHDRAVLK